MEALIAKIEAAYRRKNLPEFRVGDVIRVHQRIREGGKERIQVFEGMVIAKKHGNGMNGTFTVRRVASGIGVERIYPLHTPAVAKIERVRTADVRKAKLYYLRDRVGRRARLKTTDAVGAWQEPTAEELAAVEAEAAQETPEASTAETQDQSAIAEATEDTTLATEPEQAVVEASKSEESEGVAAQEATGAEQISAPSADENPVVAPSFSVDVKDIDEAIKKIKNAGGLILKDKTQVGEMGYVAYFKDTEGNILSVWQNILKK